MAKFQGFKKKKSKPASTVAEAASEAVGKKTAGKVTARGPRKKIGQILVDLGFIDDDQLGQALNHQTQTGELLGKCAIAFGWISEDQLIQALAEQQGLRTVSLKDEEFKIDQRAVETVDRTMCELYKVMPIRLDGAVLTIAISDPTNLAALDDLRSMLSIDGVEPVVASESEINDAIQKHYEGGGESLAKIIKEIESDEDLMSAKVSETGSIDLQNMEEMIEAAPVRKLLNMVLLMAIRDKASDIHFEPFEDEFKIRYRMDGTMIELMPPPRHLAPAIASRIKVMANLNIAERRLPQDGRIELNIGSNPVDLRVSVLPTMFGEGVVCRVLDRTVVSLDLNKIGMPPKILSKFRELIKLPHGIVLVTGPTGSGKTTTLYSALSELNDISVKIITTEDPVEYDIEGIVQVPINNEIGVTFAACLRSILRQDPDVILVGEIRDFETAQISIQASLTGHLVFSTLHTNDAAGAVTRLRDMGVAPFLITATVEGVLAQRLVRKICTNCKQPYTPSPEVLLELKLPATKMQGRQFFQGRGCEKCNSTGHKGRTGLYELFVMNDEMRDLINQGCNKDQLTNVARKNGMVTLREAGLKAIFEGITTVEEVVRETIVDEI